jgi:hypothetical protein
LTTAAHTDKHEEQTLHTGGSVTTGYPHGECDKYDAPVGDGGRRGRRGGWARGGERSHHMWACMAKASHPHIPSQAWAPPPLPAPGGPHAPRPEPTMMTEHCSILSRLGERSRLRLATGSSDVMVAKDRDGSVPFFPSAFGTYPGTLHPSLPPTRTSRPRNTRVCKDLGFARG